MPELSPTLSRYRCPCCGYPTLTERAAYEICELCNWEDDGQDEAAANEVWGGPNSDYSLAEARANFLQYRVMYAPGRDQRIIKGDSMLEYETKGLLIEAFSRRLPVGMWRAPAPEAMARLIGYDWPGNVRELRNVIERMVILSDGDLELQDVPPEIRGPEDDGSEDLDGGEILASLAELAEGTMPLPEGLSLKEFREAVERAFIRRRLQELGWNVSRTAESLGIERTHLHKKMRLLGIQRGGA